MNLTRHVSAFALLFLLSLSTLFATDTSFPHRNSYATTLNAAAPNALHAAPTASSKAQSVFVVPASGLLSPTLNRSNRQASKTRLLAMNAADTCIIWVRDGPDDLECRYTQSSDEPICWWVPVGHYEEYECESTASNAESSTTAQAYGTSLNKLNAAVHRQKTKAESCRMVFDEENGWSYVCEDLPEPDPGPITLTDKTKS